jgi:hypothetical protein
MNRARSARRSNASQEKLLLPVRFTQVTNGGDHVFAAWFSAARPLNLAGALAATSQIESQNRESLRGKDSCSEYQMAAKARTRASGEYELAQGERRELAA